VIFKKVGQLSQTNRTAVSVVNFVWTWWCYTGT